MLDNLPQFDREKLPAKSFHLDDETGYDATSWRTRSHVDEEFFAIQLWLIKGLTYLEVSAILGLSDSAVQAHIQSGLLRFRLVLPELKEGKVNIASAIIESYAHEFTATANHIVRTSRCPTIIPKNHDPAESVTTSNFSHSLSIATNSSPINESNC